MNKTFIFSLIRSICCHSASLKDQARLGLRKNKVKKSYQNHDSIDGFESDPYYVNLDISWERNNVAWKKTLGTPLSRGEDNQSSLCNSLIC